MSNQRIITTVVEQHGIDDVPKAECTKSWADLFVIYTGLNIAMATLLVGGLLVPALSWKEVLLVLIVGNAIRGAMMVLMGQVGVDHGVSASVMSRVSRRHQRGTILCSMALVGSPAGSP